MQEFNPEVLKEIEKHFEKIKLEAGIEPEESYEKELEDFFGLTAEQFEELDKEVTDMMRRKQVQIELVSEDAVFPSYAYPTDSGFDLYSTIDYSIPPFGRALIPTGIKLSFEVGYEIQIRPKSGLAINEGIMVLNTPGTVDAGYTGEIKVILFNTNNSQFLIKKGMKIAQAVLCPVMNGKFVLLKEVEKVTEKDRGENGFGSTGI